MATHIFFSGLLALCFTIAIATDHSPLQDFCVADSTSPGMISLMHISALRLYVNCGFETRNKTWSVGPSKTAL